MDNQTRKLPSIDERYISLLNVSPLPSLIHINGVIKYVNQAGLDFICAKDKSQLINKNFFSFIHPAFRTLVKKRFEKLTSGTSITAEIIYEQFVTVDKQYRDAEVASLIFDYYGKTAIQTTIRDITLQRQFERKLLQTNNTLETIIKSSPLAVYVMDPKGKVLIWNNIAEEIFGWSQKEIVGKLLPIANNKKRSEFKALMKELVSGKSFSRDLIRYRKDGSPIDVNVSATPLFDENNKIVSIVAITSDISERKKTQERLLDSERKYRTMIEQSLLSTQILSPDGKTIQVNKAWERMWGLTFDDVKNYNMLKDKQLIDKGIMPYIKKGFAGESSLIPPIKYEPLKSLSGIERSQDRWVQAFIYPVKDDKGNIREVVLVHEDITARLELEKQKDDFLGIASHELKTPVTSIKMYGQVLNKIFSQKGDAYAVDLMKKMDTQIDKLSHLISDLLDVTKVQSGKMQFNKSTFEFNELVAETIEELQRTTDRHTIEKHFSKPQKIYGDRDRIGQVITNFITNAIKYSPHANKIIIKTSLSKNAINFCVQDFGIGIPAHEQSKIFSQFYRGNEPQKATFPGIGLGLYISSEIIKRHNGKIWVESKPRKGSTFCFCIPLK